MFPICHKPQQARPACRDGDAFSQPVETKQKKKEKKKSKNQLKANVADVQAERNGVYL